MESKQIGLFGEEQSVISHSVKPKKISGKTKSEQFARDEVLENLIKERIVKFVLTGHR